MTAIIGAARPGWLGLRRERAATDEFVAPDHREDHMDTPKDAAPPDQPLPLGQRLYDNVFLLLAAGILVMLLFYTGWGLWEITTLPSRPLP